MSERSIHHNEGYLTVHIPHGRVDISVGLEDTRTHEPVTCVDVTAASGVAPAADGRIWSVDPQRTYARDGRVTLRGRKPGAVTETGPSDSLTALCAQFTVQEPDDPVKQDKELVHALCGDVVCDIENGDDLVVLVDVAIDHGRSCGAAPLRGN